MKLTLRIIAAAVMVALGIEASAQAQYFENARVDGEGQAQSESAIADSLARAASRASKASKASRASKASKASRASKASKAHKDSMVTNRVRSIEELNAYLDTLDMSRYDNLISTRQLPNTVFLPSVFTGYEYPDTTPVFAPELSGKPYMAWIEEEMAMQRKIKNLNYALYLNNPENVSYNINLLPEAPKVFHAVVDPVKHTIKIEEIIDKADAVNTIDLAPGKKRHWIRSFSASLQFSQAYVSPNWYQGGNNNLNALGQLYYNVKLNTQYHPDLLFETTAQYKLGINSAPDDSIHSYNITDDIFQVNTTFGIRAHKRWYYSFTGQFKTQLLNSYQSNTRNLRSSLLSPGELTAGIGMTYNYANAKKTFTFDASLAPVSYALRTCISNRIDPTKYNIEAGRKTSHHFGSTAEFKIFWRLSYNITFASRIFAFTDYETAQADWENTLAFEINQFLTTQIYCHARYDSSTPRCDDPSWKKLQIKEILSVGFAYKFSTI